MPVYAYKGVIAGNQTTQGMVNAENLRSARNKLRAEGIFPIQLTQGRLRPSWTESLQGIELSQFRSVPDLDLALFSNQLATLLAAGVPVVESLGALTEQIENDRLKRTIGRLRESVNEGASLADAMTEHSAVFDVLYRALVRAGESAGALELVLRRLGDYIEARLELRNKVTSALTYPVVLLLASAVVLGFLLVNVIPQIATLIEDMDQELPFITQVVLSASEFLREWWLILVIAVALIALGLNRLINTKAGRLAWDQLRIRLPIIGRTVRYIAISRFSRTLSTLMNGGVNIVQALDIARSTSGNAVIGEAIDSAREAITQGASIAAPLRQSGQFPPMVTHMISVGEASGELDSMLAKVSDTYDELVENSLNRLTSLLGPILLIVVASVVLIVILSTLQPLMSLTNSIG